MTEFRIKSTIRGVTDSMVDPHTGKRNKLISCYTELFVNNEIQKGIKSIMVCFEPGNFSLYVKFKEKRSMHFKPEEDSISLEYEGVDLKWKISYTPESLDITSNGRDVTALIQHLKFELDGPKSLPYLELGYTAGL